MNSGDLSTTRVGGGRNISSYFVGQSDSMDSVVTKLVGTAEEQWQRFAADDPDVQWLKENDARRESFTFEEWVRLEASWKYASRTIVKLAFRACSCPEQHQERCHIDKNRLVFRCNDASSFWYRKSNDIVRVVRPGLS